MPNGVTDVATRRHGRKWIIADDFEDGDISEYGDSGNDSTSKFDVQTSVVSNESHALRLQTSNPARISSLSGLPEYPAAGDVFRWDTRTASSSMHFGFRFGIQSTNLDNLYLARPSTQHDAIQLYKRDAGSWNKLAETLVTIPVDEWMTVEVEWRSNGTIIVRLFDSTGSQIGDAPSATDTSYTDGGIGWAGTTDLSSAQTAYFDHLRLVG